jgi:glucose/arabinose dehydrogenase
MMNRTISEPRRLGLDLAALAFLVLGLVLARPTSGATTLPPGFHATLVTTQLVEPTAMEIAPDGRIFICQQRGAVRVVKNMTLLPTPFAQVPAHQHISGDERGLLGLAFDPGFATNHFVYLNYSFLDTNIFFHASSNRVTRLLADGDVAVPGSEITIFQQEPNTSKDIESYHVAGAIHFGPDGKLYIATGDGSGYRQFVQSFNKLYGKILRVNADGSIPADNPFYHAATNQNRAIWALGFRNPFTFAFQPGTGRLFVNDVGSGYEEVNDVVRGGNYGWPCHDGPINLSGVCCDSCDTNTFRRPIHSYQGGAVTGGTFYNPIAPQFPAVLRGAYFFSDLVRRTLNWIDLPTTNVSCIARAASTTSPAARVHSGPSNTPTPRPRSARFASRPD